MTFDVADVSVKVRTTVAAACTVGTTTYHCTMVVDGVGGVRYTADAEWGGNTTVAAGVALPCGTVVPTYFNASALTRADEPEDPTVRSFYYTDTPAATALALFLGAVPPELQRWAAPFSGPLDAAECSEVWQVKDDTTTTYSWLGAAAAAHAAQGAGMGVGGLRVARIPARFPIGGAPAWPGGWLNGTPPA